MCGDVDDQVCASARHRRRTSAFAVGFRTWRATAWAGEPLSVTGQMVHWIPEDLVMVGSGRVLAEREGDEFCQ